MTQKRREQRRQRHAAVENPIRWPQVLLAIVLGGAMALVVLGAMVPSESAISDGTYAPIVAGWCLLLVVWSVAMWLDEKPGIRLGWTEMIGAGLVGWHSLAALVSLGETNGRQAMNAHWLVMGYGIAFFLLRQTVRTAEQAKSVFAAMVWLATLLASLGLYQYFYSNPTQRVEYERDPIKYLQANGIPTEVGSPQRELFENRLRSVEPLATFALTNSLAGFLGPWLVGTLAVGLVNFRRREMWPALVALAVSAAVLAGCLALTKSRTAYLAVLGGLVLVGLYGRGGKSEAWWLDWRIPGALAGAAMVIGIVAVMLGGLDVEVLSEAPKSVLYRLEYWQATARVIGTYPLFGCGPGNFQEAYAVFKLPQASETVADPHNFLLEIWATAGTGAMALLVTLLVGFAADVAGAATGARQPHAELEQTPVAPAKWIVFGGAAVGLLLAPAVGSAMGYPLEAVRSVPVVLLLGGILIAAMWRPVDSWLAHGELTTAAAVIPQVVLLVNLLAAGAVSFPGVVATVVVLGPVALCIAGGAEFRMQNAEFRNQKSELHLSKPVAGLVTGAAGVLAMACLYTEYYPVMNCRMVLADALYRLDQREFQEAEPKAALAAEADSLSPEPWRLLGDLKLARWQASGLPKDWESFVEVSDMFRKLNLGHHLAWYTRGNWYLTAWKKSGRKEDLEAAISAYTQASSHFPNRALYHAQLAWVLHLAGQASVAQQEAELAYGLDQKMPHKEQKLERQHVTDPVITKDKQTVFREETAEQTLEKLRIVSAEDKP